MRQIVLDTETTGLAGGTGTVAFLVGLAFLSEGVLVVRQYLMARFGAEEALLAEVARDLHGAGGVVTYNGKSFDGPLLAARFRLAGRSDPLGALPHLDLLHPVRRLFAGCLTDCRLATAERQLLGFVREDDLPGWQVPMAWLDYVRQGEAARLPAVVRHNRRDLVSLAALLPALGEAHGDPEAVGGDTLAVARAFAKAGEEGRALDLLERVRPRLDPAGLLELARLYRRCGRWEPAIAIWGGLADNGCRESLERLAKYHEHVRRDPRRALVHAAQLAGSPEGDHRVRRLRAKIGEP